MFGVKITVRHVVPNNNRRYGKRPAFSTEEQRFFGHNLDGTGYLGLDSTATARQARVKNDSRQKQQEIMEKIGDVETWRLLE